MIILLFSLYTIIRLGWDTIVIRRATKSITQKGYNMRNLVMAPAIALIALVSYLLEPSAPYWTRIVAQLAIFVFVFDYAINLTTGKKLIYSNPNSNSRYERIRAKIGVYPELFIKLWLLACGLGVFYQWELL